MCDCCRNTLEHAISCLISRYEAPIPPPTLKQVMGELYRALEDWREDEDLRKHSA